MRIMNKLTTQRKVSPVPEISYTRESRPPPLRLQIPPLTTDRDFIVLSASTDESANIYSAVSPIDMDWNPKDKRSGSDPSLASLPSYDEESGQRNKNRPSTAGTVIRKLHIESQGESGIAISGIFVWANCYIIMLIMSAFFLIMGVVLSATSYSIHEEDDDNQSESQAKEEWSHRAKIIGPLFIIIGIIMMILGLVLWLIGWKVAKDEREFSYLQRNPSGKRQSRFSSGVKETENYSPGICEALPIGLLATPTIPIIVNYPVAVSGRAVGGSLTVPIAQLDSSSLVENVYGSRGGGNESTLPIPNVNASRRPRSRRNSLPLMENSARRFVRRGSTRHACAINEAKQELRFIARPRSVNDLPSMSYKAVCRPISSRSNKLSYDVACFPVSGSTDHYTHNDIPSNLTVYTAPNLPEIQITGTGSAHSNHKRVTFLLDKDEVSLELSDHEEEANDDEFDVKPDRSGDTSSPDSAIITNFK